MIISYYSLGCKVNLYESEVWDWPEDHNYVLLNSGDKLHILEYLEEENMFKVSINNKIGYIYWGY